MTGDCGHEVDPCVSHTVDEREICEDCCEQCQLEAEQRREIAELRAWKESALVVLSEWDRVHEALGSPGPLGMSKATCSLVEIERRSAAEVRYEDPVELDGVEWCVTHDWILAEGSSWCGHFEVGTGECSTVLLFRGLVDG